MEEPRPAIAEVRTAFFARTRLVAGVFYTGGAAAAIGLGIPALLDDSSLALVAMLGGVLVMLALGALGVIVAIPANVTRGVLVAIGAIGVALNSLVDLDRFDRALVLGVGCGAAVGLIVVMVLIRRRLAHDDALLERQIELGYNPADPWSLFRRREKVPRGS